MLSEETQEPILVWVSFYLKILQQVLKFHQREHQFFSFNFDSSKIFNNSFLKNLTSLLVFRFEALITF